MRTDLIQHLLNFTMIYEYVSVNKKSVTDIKEYLMHQAVDESDDLAWQDTPQAKVPQMQKVEYEAVTWIEEQKE